jgi:tetratricopeptide (TPR) repeat protein
MSESELNDTQPNGSLNDTKPNPVVGETRPTAVAPVSQPKPPEPEKKNFPRWLVALCVVLIIVIGALFGYQSGMGQRYAVQNTAQAGQLEEQFKLGQQAVADGNYDLAEQYFKGIITRDSNFPGIQAAYADLLLRMQMTPTPVFSPTPEISPTPDLRGVEEIYNAALQALNSGNWDGAITNLDSLRKANPAYRTAEVDGMYYMALRQRGVAKIAAPCQTVNLEGGIYDLTLAEHFLGTGKLDSKAESLRTYARLYIIAASFWDQDWLQAQNFFAQVMAGYPNMSDSSCLTATDRWVVATNKIAAQYLAAGDNCNAASLYATAFVVNSPYNATVYPTATQVSNLCSGGGAPVEPPVETPTGPTGTPTETPTFTPSATCDPALGTCP